MSGTVVSRRWFIAGMAAGLAACQSSKAPRRLMAPTVDLDNPPLNSDPRNLLDVAAGHVGIAEKSKSDFQLWGRIGGSRAEGESGSLLASQLAPWVNRVQQESFPFEASRPISWQLNLSGATRLESAVPAPATARFPDGPAAAPLQMISTDADWGQAGGRWAFIPARTGDTIDRNRVRDEDLYSRALEAGAFGLVFALPTPAGSWKSVAEVDFNRQKAEERFERGLRPIPCYCVDSEDGQRLAEAAPGAPELRSEILFEPMTRRNGVNIVGMLRGPAASPIGPGAIGIFANLDGYFSGATDNASGLAAMVGIAQRLALAPRLARRSDVYFVGLSAWQDDKAGLKAFIEAAPKRFSNIHQFYFLARPGGHNPGRSGEDNPGVVYVGNASWGSVAQALPAIFSESGFQGGTAPIVRSSPLGFDLGGKRKRSFCLQKTPIQSMTDHDTIDTVSIEDLNRATEFHLRLIETAGALVPGTFRESLRPVAVPTSRA